MSGRAKPCLVERVRLKEVTWLGDGDGEAAARAGTRLTVKVRSTRPPKDAALVWDDDNPFGGWAVDFAEPEEGVAPGQACVFYSPDAAHDRVLGGGWIADTRAAA